MMQSLLMGVSISAQTPDFEKMVEYAIKAPSGHNTQPWKFKFTEKGIDILPNFDRSLPVVDGTHRELYVSIGAATENLCITARELGYKEEVSLLTNTKGECYIHVALVKSEQTLFCPLFAQIVKRQTNRRVYTGKLVDEDTLAYLKKIPYEKEVHVYYYKNGNASFNLLKEFVFRGNEIQMTDKNFKEELTGWIRLNKKQVAKTRDGLTYSTMGSPSIPTFIGKPIIKSFLKPKAQNKSDSKKIASSSHLVLFTTCNNTPEEWISLGRSLERFLLETTRMGIANAYMNQPCEVYSLATELQTKLSINGEVPTLLLRIGYANSMPYSPRKEVKDVIIRKPE